MPGEFDEGPILPAPIDERAEDSKDKKFFKAASEGIKLGIATVTERFENPDHPEKRLYFHIGIHSINVAKISEAILTAIHTVSPTLVTKRDILLGGLLGANHDTVQNGEIQQKSDPNSEGKIMLRFARETLANEKATAIQLIAYMDQVNEQEGDEIFTQRDKEIAHEGIMLTVPNFDKEKKTVTQPGFAGKHIVAQAVALADLANAGKGKLKDTKHDVVSLLLEENPDIAALLNEESLHAISTSDQQWYKSRIVKSLIDQKLFILGRKAQTAEDISTMHPDARKALEGFFPNFDSNAEGMGKFVEVEKGKSLPELMSDIRDILNPDADERMAQKI